MHIDSLRGAVMFQESLVESTPLLRTRNRWPVFISVAAQATILTLAVAIPLLHPEVLPTHALHHLDFLPPPPKPPTPPPQPVRVQSAPATSAPAAPAMQQARIDPGITRQLTSDLKPVDGASLPVAFAPAGATISSFNNITTAPAPHVVPTPAANTAPVSVSQGVLAGYLLNPIRPEYPPIARAVHVEGTVIIHAIISKSGHVENPQVISGPPMLQAAALEAVRNARYRPYLLNQQPTEVETTFSINFHLGS
jgi:periplasmic protein TonB